MDQAPELESIPRPRYLDPMGKVHGISPPLHLTHSLPHSLIHPYSTKKKWKKKKKEEEKKTDVQYKIKKLPLIRLAP